jgi:hypothetical protein
MNENLAAKANQAASSEGGTVRLSAFAVLRLMTSLYLSAPVGRLFTFE